MKQKTYYGFLFIYLSCHISLLKMTENPTFGIAYAGAVGKSIGSMAASANPAVIENRLLTRYLLTF